MTELELRALYEGASKAALTGDSIFSQIDPRIVDNADFTSASDCRLILITDKTGKHLDLVNHGRPQDNPSNIDFDGHGVMVMPEGDTPAQQLKNARAILERLKHQYGGVVSKEFLERETARGGIIPKCAKEIYGPASCELKDGQERSGLQEQLDRLVQTDIMVGGNAVSIDPEITDNYAIGFREPADQKAFLLALSVPPKHTSVARIDGGDTAETSFVTIEQLFDHTLKGTEATAEHMKHIPAQSTMIVLVHANNSSRPVDPRVAIDEKFGTEQFSQLPIIVVNNEGAVIGQYPSMFVVERMLAAQRRELSNDHSG